MDSVHHIWCPLFSQEFQDLPDGAETTLTNMELWTGDGLAAGSAREGVNPGILATYGDGGIVKTDEPGLNVPSSLRAISSRSVKRYGEISENVGTETRPRNIAFNFLVRAK
ncbi:tail fiber protein [Escherichia coli]|nr:tail fiber protein [Escherichia coli]